MALLGMVIGTQISKKIDGAKLKPAFWMVCINNGNLHYRHRIFFT
jgi:hypothetical protein